MIENFKYLIDLYGHIPNGNRWHTKVLDYNLKCMDFRLYYTRRSQPPVFPQLVDDYLQSKNDLTSERLEIASVVWALDQEFKFWQTKMVNVKGHQLARYWVDVGGPRPGEYQQLQYLVLWIYRFFKSLIKKILILETSLELTSLKFGIDIWKVEQNQVNAAIITPVSICVNTRLGLFQ